MKLLTRHVLAEFFRAAGFAFALFFGVFLLIDLFEQFRWMLPHHAGLLEGAVFYLYRLPYFVLLLVPAAVLLGSVLAAFNLASRTELLAVRAAGASLRRFFAPLVVVGALGALASFAASEWVVPQASRRARYYEEVVIKKKRMVDSFRQGQIWFRDGAYFVHVGLFVPEAGVLREVSLYRLADGSRLVEREDAREAVWKGGRWVAPRAVVRTFEGGRLATEEREEVPLPLSYAPAEFTLAQGDPEQMSIRDLRALIDHLRREGFDSTRSSADLAAKGAFPWVCLLMVLLGPPSGLLAPKRGGIGVGVGISLILAFLYWMVFALSVTLARRGLLPPYAPWGADLLFGGAGLALWSRLDRPA